MASKTKVVGGVAGIASLIVAAVLGIEGGYVNNPKDPGGETNHGITIGVARDNGYTGSMKDMPKEFAEGVYLDKYVIKPGFFPLIEIQPAIVEELVDTGVNTGPARSSKWFQQSLNALSNEGKSYPQIAVDGKIGPNTIKTYQSLEKARGKVKACQLMLKMLDIYQGHYYISINNPTFTVGWIDHRIGNVPLEKCQ